MLINNIPNYKKYRQDILPLGYKVHLLPPEVKKKYERPEVFYAVGICTEDKYAYEGVRDISTSWYNGTETDNPEPSYFV